MLRPERMDRVRLLCRNEDTKTVVKALADLRALHITTHSPEDIAGKRIGNGTPTADAQSLSDAMVKTRSMIEKLGIKSAGESAAPRTEEREESLAMNVRIAAVQRISAAYGEIETAIGRTEQAITRIDEQDALLCALLPLESPIETIGRTRSAKTLLVRGSISGLTAGITPLFEHYDQKTATTLLVIHARDEKAIPSDRVIDLSKLEGLQGTPQTARAAIAMERSERKRELERLQEERASYRDHRKFLLATELELARALLEAQAPLAFGQTRHITIIEGFVPTRRTKDIDMAMRGENVIALLESAPADDAPTSLSNPKPARGFETLLRLYALPKYDEIDPTSVMAITFPIFFGFMLGDIGYGLVALATAIAIHRKYPKLRRLMEIFILSAASTIVFGLVYGEAFGTGSLLGLQLTPFMHRADDIGTLFAAAAALGIAHMALGVLLGVADSIRSRKGIRAAAGKASWLILLAAGLLLCADYGLFTGAPLFSAIPPTSIAFAWTLLAASLVGLFVAERSRGIIEAPMAISNTLSYTRLAALGISSITLAFVINSGATELFAKGGLWLALGAALLIVGHAANLALGLLGAFLHSLRLHYVEFYGKFYEGGGDAYRPFGDMNTEKGVSS